MIKIIGILLLFLGFGKLAAQKQATTSNIDWRHFLAKSDMVFDTLNTKWEEGAFIGNGLLGAMAYMKDRNALRFEIGRTNVMDHRKEKMNELIGKCRLPIGHFVLRPVGQIISNTARVDLWNAEIRGFITTTKGSIQWRAVTLSQTDVIVLETQTTGEEKLFGWEWIPEKSVSSRLSYPNQVAPLGYVVNPTGKFHHQNGNTGTLFYTQPMIAGGCCTTAWKQIDQEGKKVFYISIGYSQQNGKSDNEALKNINNAAKNNLAELVTIHRNWWHNYYQQSFLSMPDGLLESFYWIQQYKLASASRQGKPLIDLMGPWFNPTPWPAYWWNLNEQLTYSPLYAANHLDIASVLPFTINKNINNLIENAPEQYRSNSLALGRAGGGEMNAPILVTTDTSNKSKPASELELGNATWLLYYYWSQYRYSMDEKILASLFPLLKRSINYYLHILQKEDDGKYHLPFTASPEYPGGITRDCNYDLSVLKWGCETLLKANNLLKANDKLVPKWDDVLQNLVDYPTDTNGLKIGRDVAFSISHRHFSHLLMIYPLHTMNWEQPENRDLIERSLKHWHSMPASMQGYSFTGGASIYATMGRGNNARDYLHTLVNKFVKPNTMYVESGPVIETPLAAATSIQEMFLQSWGDKIRVFPAIPDDWANASFKDLRAEGAFLISAVRKNGETKWVKIKADVGGLCIVQPNLKGVVKIKSTNAVKLIDKINGNYEMNLKKGDEVLLFVDDNELKNNLKEIEWKEIKLNPFGKKKY